MSMELDRIHRISNSDNIHVDAYSRTRNVLRPNDVLCISSEHAIFHKFPVQSNDVSIVSNTISGIQPRSRSELHYIYLQILVAVWAQTLTLAVVQPSVQLLYHSCRRCCSVWTEVPSENLTGSDPSAIFLIFPRTKRKKRVCWKVAIGPNTAPLVHQRRS